MSKHKRAILLAFCAVLLAWAVFYRAPLGRYFAYWTAPARIEVTGWWGGITYGETASGQPCWQVRYTYTLKGKEYETSRQYAITTARNLPQTIQLRFYRGDGDEWIELEEASGSAFVLIPASILLLAAAALGIEAHRRRRNDAVVAPTLPGGDSESWRVLRPWMTEDERARRRD